MANDLMEKIVSLCKRRAAPQMRGEPRRPNFYGK